MRRPLDSLYARALPASRSGPLYGAFPYPTKISPEAIALFIAAHTKPGDTVFDGFAGSGTTGLAALLCENPSAELRSQAKKLGLNVEWGARNAVLYELGALGAFVARTLTDPPDPGAFRMAAEQILDECEEESGWMYEARDPDGNNGIIRYVIWSDVLRCPSCAAETSLYEACVSREPARIDSRFVCSACNDEYPLDEAERITTRKRDGLNSKTVRQRARVIACVYGKTGKKTWARAAVPADEKLLKRIEAQPFPDAVPNVEIPWGDLYRRGYHQGVTHLHHFYTRRNLIAFARLWERTSAFDHRLSEALRFWLLSYNASHATIMTRVVAKRGQKDLVLTSAQPGVLYISGLPVEKNLFDGLRRKLATIVSAFSVIHGSKGRVEVHQKSSCKVVLPDESVDYVFTDPPFGANIPYAEISFLNEAWIGRYTDRADEVIVSNAQDKSVDTYRALLTDALSEARRILKKNGKATLVFHSASAQVWNALQCAYSDAGFAVECAGILDKTQGSFKQVTTAGAVSGDPLLLLAKHPKAKAEYTACVWSIAQGLVQEALTLDPSEQTAQRLYSRLVGHFLIRGAQVPLDADDFYRWHDTRRRGKVSEGAGA
ncbi:MAG: DNA methyltransferase [Steroidobacteraceae bacterium]